MAFSNTDGIDVSHYNGSVNWSAVAESGIGFSYAKATEGTGFQDSKFSANYAAMGANGMLRGAYHFFRPSEDPIAQADNFLKLVPLISPGDLPPVLDIEVTDGQAASVIVAGLISWLQRITTVLDRTPMIYTSASFWSNNLAANSALGAYPLWVAHYTTNLAPTLPPGFGTYTFWQYTQSGQVLGVVGSVDLDRFNGSVDELRRLADY